MRESARGYLRHIVHIRTPLLLASFMPAYVYVSIYINKEAKFCSIWPNCVRACLRVRLSGRAGERDRVCGDICAQPKLIRNYSPHGRNEARHLRSVRQTQDGHTHTQKKRADEHRTVRHLKKINGWSSECGFSRLLTSHYALD